MLPSKDHPLRGLTWITFKRGRVRVVVRTLVVTWEPLVTQWMVQVPAGKKQARQLRSFARQLDALRYAARYFDLQIAREGVVDRRRLAKPRSSWRPPAN